MSKLNPMETLRVIIDHVRKGQLKHIGFYSNEEIARALVEITEQTSQRQWLLVSESKPADGQEVLALVHGKRHVLAFHVETIAYVANRFGRCYWSCKGERIWVTPTHWMPLPLAPESV